MSAVPDLVSNIVRFCSMYKTSHFFDSWDGLLLVLDHDSVFRVESGVQNRYSHRFGRVEKRVNISIDRGQQIVHSSIIHRIEYRITRCGSSLPWVAIMLLMPTLLVV